MNNPGIVTLKKFLSIVKKKEPVIRQSLVDSLSTGRSYDLADQYIAFCLDAELVEISKIERGRGPWPQKFYVLTSRGRKLTEILEAMKIDLP